MRRTAPMVSLASAWQVATNRSGWSASALRFTSPSQPISPYSTP